MNRMIVASVLCILVVAREIRADDEIVSATCTGVEDLIEFRFSIPKKQGHNVFDRATLVIEEGEKRMAFIPIAYAVDQKTEMCNASFRISATLAAKCYLDLGGIVVKDPRIDTEWSKKIRLADVKVKEGK